MGPTELTEGVWWVGNGGWGGTRRLSEPGDGNVFLIDGGSELALVDTGLATKNPRILANVAAAGLDPGRITAIFLTHAHCDHAGGAAWLRAKTRARIFAGGVTAKAFRTGEKLLIGGLRPFEKFSFRRPAADRILKDGEEVHVGSLRMKMLCTPGHTIDSCCYFVRIGGRRVLFSGDTVVGNQPRPDLRRIFRGMLGWIDGHWSAPFSTYIASLERLLALRPDIMLTGHGLPNEAVSAADAMRVGIRKLGKIMNDPDLFIMFPFER